MLISENRAFALSSSNIDQYIESFNHNFESVREASQNKLDF
jgi:hypothetical protein